MKKKKKNDIQFLKNNNYAGPESGANIQRNNCNNFQVGCLQVYENLNKDLQINEAGPNSINNQSINRSKHIIPFNELGTIRNDQIINFQKIPNDVPYPYLGIQKVQYEENKISEQKEYFPSILPQFSTKVMEFKDARILSPYPQVGPRHLGPGINKLNNDINEVSKEQMANQINCKNIFPAVEFQRNNIQPLQKEGADEFEQLDLYGTTAISPLISLKTTKRGNFYNPIQTNIQPSQDDYNKFFDQNLSVININPNSPPSISNPLDVASKPNESNFVKNINSFTANLQIESKNTIPERKFGNDLQIISENNENENFNKVNNYDTLPKITSNNSNSFPGMCSKTVFIPKEVHSENQNDKIEKFFSNYNKGETSNPSLNVVNSDSQIKEENKEIGINLDCSSSNKDLPIPQNQEFQNIKPIIGSDKFLINVNNDFGSQNNSENIAHAKSVVLQERFFPQSYQNMNAEFASCNNCQVLVKNKDERKELIFKDYLFQSFTHKKINKHSKLDQQIGKIKKPSPPTRKIGQNINSRVLKYNEINIEQYHPEFKNEQKANKYIEKTKPKAKDLMVNSLYHYQRMNPIGNGPISNYGDSKFPENDMKAQFYIYFVNGKANLSTEKSPSVFSDLLSIIDPFSYPHFEYCFSEESPISKTVPYLIPILPLGKELELNFIRSLKNFSQDTNESLSTQVFLLSDTHDNINYVLKRGIYPFHYKSEQCQKIKIKNVESFITIYCNEYRIMNYYSKCKFGVKPLWFSVIYLHFHNYIITETFMEYGGEIFPSLNLKNKYDELLVITVELIKAIHFLEKFKILHNDIKVYNILLQMKSSNNFNLKIIDFDIALFIESMTREEICQVSLGYSDGFVSPEKLLFLQNIINNNLIFRKKSYDIWKSQIYSLGVTILSNIGYLGVKGISFKEFDNIKKSSDEYYHKFWAEFIDYYGSVNRTENPSKKALLFIAKCCLYYDEKRRLSTVELMTIIQDIKNNKMQDNELLYNNIIQKRKFSREELELEIEKKYIHQIKYYQKEQQVLQNDFAVLKNQYESLLHNNSVLKSNFDNTLRTQKINNPMNLSHVNKFPWLGFLYTGILQDNLPHGTGILGNEHICYVGEFTKGIKKGSGKLYNNKEDVYVGIFDGENICNEKINKTKFKGFMYFNNSENGSKFYYEGEIVNGFKSGFGKIKSSQFTYEGEWLNDLKTGKGEFIDLNKEEKFVGDFLNDLPHGIVEWFKKAMNIL